MLSVKYLRLSPQTSYLRSDLREQISFVFKLDDESKNFLLDIASEYRTEQDIENFERSVASQARLLAMRLGEIELKILKNGLPVTKFIRDLFKKKRYFLFEFRNLDKNDRNELTVTRIEVLEKPL